MQQNTPEQNYYQEDEIDLKQLFRSLADRKWFIFGFTGFITVLAIAYALIIPPTYKANISFLSPNESSVIQLNKIKLTSETSETSETIYRKFLNKVMSSQFQRKIFDENDYLARLNPENKPIKNLEDFFAEFSKSITLEENKVQKNVEKLNYEKPTNISIEGSDAKVIASFLNDLATSADKETVNEFLNIIQQKIDIRLEEISRQITLLKQHEDKIRMNKIQELSYALELAIELGIKGNNFSGLSSSSSSSSSTSLKIDLSSGESLPKWYLFGENALKKEIELLTRNTYQFIPKIATLEIESIRLKSFKVSDIGINAIQLNQHAYAPESAIKPKKKLIVAVAFIAGFILSIFLVFIMNAFRKEDDKVAV